MILSGFSILDNSEGYFWRLVILGYTIFILIDAILSIVLLNGIDSIKFLMKNRGNIKAEKSAVSFLSRKDVYKEMAEIKN